MTVPTILCHQDSYRLGLGSGHADIYQWFGRFGKDMEDARNDVARLLANAETPPPAPAPDPDPQPSPSTTLAPGDLVAVKPGATYYTGKTVPSWVFPPQAWFVKSVKNDRVVLGESKDHKANINSAFNIKDLVKKEIAPSTPPEEEFQPYLIRVTANALNVRKGPSTDFGINTVIHKGEVYTIVEEKNGWGKLKSGAGWINLQYTEKK